ncbi:hypothetical protein WG907_04480 [Sphingobium sp. AN558]|uniref:hypothetical protein n=1 Tax=Sphingobium sp. AN558 TaxID=3133442 RepID=UPI0030C29617
MTEFILRRSHAECKLAFDAIREHWRAKMRRAAGQAFPARRDGLGRFTHAR